MYIFAVFFAMAVWDIKKRDVRKYVDGFATDIYIKVVKNIEDLMYPYLHPEWFIYLSFTGFWYRI